MTKLEWPRQQTQMGSGHFVGHLIIGCWTKHIFELEWKVDRSNSYIKFGRNPIKNDWVRVTTTANIDSWWPFCLPSWLSDVRQNPYSNLNKRLMEAIHIWNLEKIRLKMTELEWPRTDRQTGKLKTIEHRQHSLVGHFVHILSLVTDNNPSWINKRKGGEWC